MSRWNQWVEERGGEGKATLAGMLVGKLSCHAEGHRYQVHEGSEKLDLERRQRQGLLKSLELNSPGSNAEERFFERVRHWKELACEFLLELYTLRRVIQSVNQLYYEGQQVLFPQVAQGFEELVGYIERLVGLYNPDCGLKGPKIVHTASAVHRAFATGYSPSGMIEGVISTLLRLHQHNSSHTATRS
jgi:hypothetical protein